MASLSDDEAARIRAGFESLKDRIRDGLLPAAASRLFGECVQWGEEIKAIFRSEGRDALAGRDPLTRFFVVRMRGAEEPASLAQATPESVFLLALGAFTYFDLLVDEMTLGGLAALDSAENCQFFRLTSGEADGTRIAVAAGGAGWRYDLMPVFRTKAELLAQFIDRDFAGDFDLFLRRYLAEHDIAFDADRAWQPAQTN